MVMDRLSRACRSSGVLALALTALALLIRLPYWDVIPASFDEVGQTVHSWQIAQGQAFPLVGNDAYAGPVYFYLLAALLRLGATDPVIGRAVVLVAGVLTVPVTLVWVRTMGRSVVAGAVAALLVALNPDLILVNSHIGGTTFLLPFFTTLCLMALSQAATRDSLVWLLAASIAAGLALHSNLVGGLVIVGGWCWLALSTRCSKRLGRRWPMWPLLASLGILLVYSPVIIHNLSSGFSTVGDLQERSYLWTTDPTIQSTGRNLVRLSLQTARQVGGVLEGNETPGALVGFPLLTVVLMAASLIYTTAAVSTLPGLVLLPFWLVLPVVCSHYGFISVGRFTMPLVPVWCATLGTALSAGIVAIRSSSRRPRVACAVLALGATLVLVAPPPLSLMRYYSRVEAKRASGRALLELSRHATAHAGGGPVYLSTIEEMSFVTGYPYVPDAALLMGNVHHEFLPPRQIAGRLHTLSGSALMLLSSRDAGFVSETVDLAPVSVPANETALSRGYGLFEVAAGSTPQKPDFVHSGDHVPSGLSPSVTVGRGLRLLGCSMPHEVSPPARVVLACYWEVATGMPDAVYVTFAHVYDPVAAHLATQDDHVLGRELYPVAAWEPGEVIREEHVLDIVDGTPPAEYLVWMGVYTWPDQERLAVPGHPDDLVEVGSLLVTN